jgi:hypothetical protein
VLPRRARGFLLLPPPALRERRPWRVFLPAGLGAVGRLMVIAGAEGPKWGRSPVPDIRREFITLLGGAAIFVYLLSRTFFPMAVRTYSSC